MKTFSLSAQVTVSAFTEVEANSPEEAKEIASSREVVLGGLHSGAVVNEMWIIDEADGEPHRVAVIA